jgi:hypothetical protein
MAKQNWIKKKKESQDDDSKELRPFDELPADSPFSETLEPAQDKHNIKNHDKFSKFKKPQGE